MTSDDHTPSDQARPYEPETFIDLVDLPDHFDEMERRRFFDILNWMHTAMMLSCNHSNIDPENPIPFHFIGTSLPHPSLLEVLHGGIATMVDNIFRAIDGGSVAFRDELIAQALHQETGLAIEPARTYAAEFSLRMDVGQDEKLNTLASMTRDGFRALVLQITSEDRENDAMNEAFRQIAVGIRAILGIAFQILIRDLPQITEDLGSPVPEDQIEHYRLEFRAAFERMTDGLAPQDET